MNLFKLLSGLLFFSCFIITPYVGFSQLTSIANEVVPTEYSSGTQDKIHVFCGKKGEVNASLTASMPVDETGSFEWQKYTVQTGTFDFFSKDSSGNKTSTISTLVDGCYRVIITSTSGVKTYTAWVFNNYVEITAEIPESDCNSFTLKGTIISPISFTYIDLPTGQPKELNKGIQVKWKEGSVVLNKVITTKVVDPPTKDTDYTLEVTDKFGCSSTAVIQYKSIVTKASFEYKVDERKSHSKFDEAPLTVTFTNTSENADATKYEWFLFRDLQKIKQEKEAGTFKDSIQDMIYSENPVYIYQEPGQYKVKLVSKKVSEFHINDKIFGNTCVDTFYMSGYINVDESFIEAPNVFTPGDDDDVNSTFAVRFFSMKTVKITIFNRWGKILHVWENNNVNGFYKTVEESVWDGKVGGKLATPGVYYYVVDGMGRDGVRRKANGFFHLFRGK